jgi:hypothetical protein
LEISKARGFGFLLIGRLLRHDSVEVDYFIIRIRFLFPHYQVVKNTSKVLFNLFLNGSFNLIIEETRRIRTVDEARNLRARGSILTRVSALYRDA